MRWKEKVWVLGSSMKSRMGRRGGGEEKEEGADMATKVLTWKPRGKISAT